jgi:uncharacterized protein
MNESIKSPNQDAKKVRQSLPDQLRGIALLGIVVVNAPYIAIGAEGFTPESTEGLANGLTRFLEVALAQGKFFLMFSFLFGYSLTLFLKTPTRAGLAKYRRRLLGLAVLGFLHAVLFFTGDILVSYAILGFVLLWFVSKPDKTLIAGAVISYLAGVAILGMLFIAVIAFPGSSESGAPVSYVGSFFDDSVSRLVAFPESLSGLALLQWGLVLSMFLLGYHAGRRNLLANPRENKKLWTRLVLLGGFIGLPAGLASASILTMASGSANYEAMEVLSLLIGFSTAPLLTFGYIGLVALTTQSRFLKIFEPLGRMSLTGYLGESIILVIIFSGWGFGVFGQVNAWQVVAIGIGSWLALAIFAHFWSLHFRYGPFEYLLRSWTHRSLQNMRLKN